MAEKQLGSLLRGFLLRKFEKMLAGVIREGSVAIETPDGHRYAAGDGTGKQVVARISTWSALTRIVLYPDLAFGEAYMDGDLDMVEGDIHALLEVIFKNLGLEDMVGVSKWTRGLVWLYQRIGGYNSVTRSRRNVAHHYDLDGRLYRLFLDSDQQYSCGYFESDKSSLEDAQLAKKRHLAAKLNLRDGQRVLDIGSGWGGLALYMARMFNVDVLGVTLSEEQLGVSRKRSADEGRDDKVKFELKDYRTLNGRFDRIVSVGMFEHVGRKSYSEFFSTVRDLLEDDGVAVLHHIGRMGVPYETSAWILKYIFPGGYLPSLSQVLPRIEKEGLIVTDIEVLRLHYAETLLEWRKRFQANRDKAVELYDERFARMWEFYLSAAELSFRHQDLVIHQIQMTKSREALPLTRDYIGENEDKLRQREQTANRPYAVEQDKRRA